MTTPQRFRKRPVEIEAMQWDGTAAGTSPIIQNRWRYVSTRYPDDIFPIYFQTLDRARRYDEQTAAALGCLPGMTTMRIEEWDGAKWRPLDGGAQ